jgi:hypothetical protein
MISYVFEYGGLASLAFKTQKPSEKIWTIWSAPLIFTIEFYSTRVCRIVYIGGSQPYGTYGMGSGIRYAAMW